MDWTCRIGLSVVVCLGLVLPACADDVTGGQADGDTDSSTSASTGDPGQTTPGGTEGSTPGAEDDGPEQDEDEEFETDDFETDNFETEESAGPGDPCEGIDCGEGGFCDTPEGAPVCVCEDGFASIGIECVPCLPVGPEFSPDVVTTLVVAQFSIDELDPPRTHRDDANIVLRSLDSADEVRLGNTHSGEVAQTVLPGRYEVFYEAETVGERVPVNRHARLGVYQFDDSEPVRIDVPVASIEIQVTVNGEAPPNDPTQFGYIVAVDPITGDEALLTNTTELEPRWVNVVPGTYDIHYRVDRYGPRVPADTDAVLLRGIEIRDDLEADQEFQIDVPMVSLTGAIRVAGEPAPDSPNDVGELELVDPATGAVTPLATTADGNYEIQLVPGLRNIVYRGTSPGARLPVNTQALIAEVPVGDVVEFGIDIPSVAIAGSVTLAGEEPVLAPESDGLITLVNGDDRAPIGSVAAGAYAAQVIPGTYVARYSQISAGSDLPVNTAAALGEFKVPDGEEATPPIDVDFVDVSGSFTIDGQGPPDSAYDDALIYLRNPETGDTALLGNTRNGGFTARVVPGEYEAIYGAELSEGLVPLNQAAVIDPLSAWTEATSARTLEVSTGLLLGEVQLNGSTPNTAPGRGALFLQQLDAGDAIALGDTESSLFERLLVSGRYLVRYRAMPEPDGALARELAANQDAALVCIEVGVD